jgi:hypothetical protein
MTVGRLEAAVRPGDVVVVDTGHGRIRMRVDGTPGSASTQALLGTHPGQRVRWRSDRGPMMIKVIAIEPNAPEPITLAS